LRKRKDKLILPKEIVYSGQNKKGGYGNEEGKDVENKICKGRHSLCSVYSPAASDGSSVREGKCSIKKPQRCNS